MLITATILALAILPPPDRWTPPAPGTFAMHVEGAMRTNVGEMRVAFDAERAFGDGTRTLSLSSFDVKLTCHPLHLPDAPGTAQPVDARGLPTRTPETPFSVKTAAEAWLAALSLYPDGPLGAGESGFVTGPGLTGIVRVLSLDPDRVRLSGSFDLDFGGRLPTLARYTAVVDRTSGTLLSVEGELGSVPPVEGRVLRVMAAQFSATPGKKGRTMLAECDHGQDGGADFPG
ncbi:MAG: hypothetical protein KIS66_13345 [Fimbriimonadaceae bacterium]|nr:hypothetical protein [Fimbriimonadaceae bacterium]